MTLQVADDPAYVAAVEPEVAGALQQRHGALLLAAPHQPDQPPGQLLLRQRQQDGAVDVEGVEAERHVRPAQVPPPARCTTPRRRPLQLEPPRKGGSLYLPLRGGYDGSGPDGLLAGRAGWPFAPASPEGPGGVATGAARPRAGDC